MNELTEMSLDATLRRQINWLPGDRVRLYPDTCHEGPHADDEHTPEAPIMVIASVDRHPANPSWVIGFTVMGDGEPYYVRAGAVRTFVHDPEAC